MAHTALVSTLIVRPVQLGTIPYRHVKLNAFLLADILHLSHTQLARIDRHDFTHPFLGFILCYGLEYLEGSWHSDLSSSGRVSTARV